MPRTERHFLCQLFILKCTKDKAMQRDSSHLKLILLKPHLIVRRKNTVLKILRCICWANKPWPFVSKSRSCKYIKTRTLYNSQKEMHFPCTKLQIYSLNDVSNGLPLQWILYQVGKCQVVYFDSSATQSQGTVWLLFPRTNKNKSIESQNNSKLLGPAHTSEETELFCLLQHCTSHRELINQTGQDHTVSEIPQEHLDCSQLVRLATEAQWTRQLHSPAEAISSHWFVPLKASNQNWLCNTMAALDYF